MRYPPELSEEQAAALIADIKDYQVTHGSLLKLVQTEEDHIVHAHPVGISVFPTLFPRHLFQEALALQEVYDKLYAAVAEDEEWLFSVLEELIELDPLARCLWDIYEEVRKEGYVQDLRLGVWRNDYMLEVNGVHGELGIKQVEFNTIAVAGGIHGNKISDMHLHLQQTGAYHQPPSPSLSPTSSQAVEIEASSLPPNTTLTTITTGLKTAHLAYGPPKTPGIKQTCILFIVQPRNFNIVDERPLEYALWNATPQIPAYRLTFGPDVLEHTTLTPTLSLLYHPPSRPGTTHEVSVVYFRSAFEAHEYAPHAAGRSARLQLERSRAIKCPSVLGHLATLKKVQQALAVPGVLGRFLDPDEVARVERSFAPLWPLDGSAEGLRARELASSEEAAGGYVLKPSLEGGGHNVYASDIPGFLRSVPRERWGRFVLMGKIVPPGLRGVLMSQRGIYEGRVVSELGVFGVVLWRRKEGMAEERAKAEVVAELEPSWSFKTKSASVDEMSVVKGYGCFDSPLLVDPEVFAACRE